MINERLCLLLFVSVNTWLILIVSDAMGVWEGEGLFVAPEVGFLDLELEIDYVCVVALLQKEEIGDFSKGVDEH